jgi:hypothetical protein
MNEKNALMMVWWADMTKSAQLKQGVKRKSGGDKVTHDT